MTPEAMAALHARCFADRPWGAAELAALRDKPTTLTLIHPNDAGFLLIQSLPPEAEILTLAVAPDARRGGIASALLRKAMHQLAETGTQSLFLEVAADNAPALALYASHGFSKAGQRKGYYRRAGAIPMDAVILRRALVHGS